MCGMVTLYSRDNNDALPAMQLAENYDCLFLEASAKIDLNCSKVGCVSGGLYWNFMTSDR